MKLIGDPPLPFNINWWNQIDWLNWKRKRAADWMEKIAGYEPEAPLPRANSIPEQQASLPFHLSCPFFSTNGNQPMKETSSRNTKVNEKNFWWRLKGKTIKQPGLARRLSGLGRKRALVDWLMEWRMNEINQLTSSEAGARAEQSTNQLTNEINKFNFMELMVVAQQVMAAARGGPQTHSIHQSKRPTINFLFFTKEKERLICLACFVWVGMEEIELNYIITVFFVLEFLSSRFHTVKIPYYFIPYLFQLHYYLSFELWGGH